MKLFGETSAATIRLNKIASENIVVADKVANEVKDRVKPGHDALEKINKTQEEIAAELGIHPSTVSRHFGSASRKSKSRRNPNAHTLSGYARLLGAGMTAKLFIDPTGAPQTKRTKRRSRRHKKTAEAAK